MRKSFQRVLTVSTTALAVAASLCVTAPAAHAAAPTCDVVVADPEIAGSNPLKIAVRVVSARHQVLCVELVGFANVVVVLKSDVAFTPPSVTPSTRAGRCPNPIIDMTNPFPLSMSYGVTPTNPFLCFAKDGVVTELAYNTGSATLPDVEVWTLANTTLNVYGTCGVKYAKYVAFLGSWQDFYDCYTRDNQVV